MVKLSVNGVSVTVELEEGEDKRLVAELRAKLAGRDHRLKVSGEAYVRDYEALKVTYDALREAARRCERPTPTTQTHERALAVLSTVATTAVAVDRKRRKGA